MFLSNYCYNSYYRNFKVIDQKANWFSRQINDHVLWYNKDSLKMFSVDHVKINLKNLIRLNNKCYQ